MSFHEVQFPPAISRGCLGGPERRTDIVEFGSGFEERNIRWADSRRRYDAGYGLRSIDDIYEIIAFFEARRGRGHGFRWKDWSDFRSKSPGEDPTPFHQVIGTGDGATATFQLVKAYSPQLSPWDRTITKPVDGSVLVAVDGEEVTVGWSVDPATGLVSFLEPPESGVEIRAGFEFDVPVRFDTERLEINVQSFLHGEIPNIPILEVRV